MESQFRSQFELKTQKKGLEGHRTHKQMQPGRLWKESRFNRLFIYIKCLCRVVLNSKYDLDTRHYSWAKTASDFVNQSSHDNVKTKYGCWNLRLWNFGIINVWYNRADKPLYTSIRLWYRALKFVIQLFCSRNLSGNILPLE